MIGLFAALIYSGPFLPLLTLLFYRRASHGRLLRNLWILIAATAFHGLSFLPFVFATLDGKSDSEHALTLPAFSGLLMFVGSWIDAICETARLRSLSLNSAVELAARERKEHKAGRFKASAGGMMLHPSGEAWDKCQAQAIPTVSAFFVFFCGHLIAAFGLMRSRRTA